MTKTLDEAIKAFECCDHGELDSRCEDCPYNGIGACCAERESDALFYLKEYQKVDSNWSEKAISELHNIADANFLRVYREDKDELTALRAFWKEQHENAPLTWDELKTMEGKPVWLEYESCNRKVWAIIDCFYTDAFLKDKMNVVLTYDYWNLKKEMLGKTWKAYRKERG